MFDPMKQTDSQLGGLDRLIERGDGDSPELAQERLEERLRPIVRLALRKGIGIPEVVGWVRRAQSTLGGDRARWPEQYAVEITRMLSATLLNASSRQQQDVLPRHADTVVGI